ncbi:unnamed protein product [Staurois parvus]|uniref:Uncharacterized protein n=1 Tax=Staurois parvus TaxID=386267 RepID=A0ABN9H2J8_9NEOB|nr:unnamed protein product [Staurois parvus]
MSCQSALVLTISANAESLEKLKVCGIVCSLLAAWFLQKHSLYIFKAVLGVGEDTGAP